LADLVLQASDATTIALVEKIEDLDLGVQVFPLSLLELREQGCPKIGRHRIGLALFAPELGHRLPLGIAAGRWLWLGAGMLGAFTVLAAMTANAFWTMSNVCWTVSTICFCGKPDFR